MADERLQKRLRLMALQEARDANDLLYYKYRDEIIARRERNKIRLEQLRKESKKCLLRRILGL